MKQVWLARGRMLFFAGLLWLLIGFQGFYNQLMLDISGTVISSTTADLGDHAHNTRIYRMKSAAGVEFQYQVANVDGDIPHNLRDGAVIEKKKWDVTWTVDGERSGLGILAMPCLALICVAIGAACIFLPKTED